MRTVSNGLPSTRSIALDLLSRRRTRGLTISELANATGRTTSNSSAVLSTLHRRGSIVRLAHRRRRQSVYVLPRFVDGRPRRGRNASTRSISTTRRAFVDRTSSTSTNVDLDALASMLDDARRLIESGSTYSAWGRIVDALDVLGHKVTP